MTRLALFAILAGCAEEAPWTTHELAKLGAIAGEFPVVGVDSDRAGGLWLAYSINSGRDYKTYDETRIVHLDADGVKLAEFHYRDDYVPVSGLAFSGDALWLHYTGSDADINRLRKLDPTTGADLGSIPTVIGMNDVAYRKGHLLMANTWWGVFTVDASTGEQLSQLEMPEEMDQLHGIATDGANMWLSSTDNFLYLVDDAGIPVGRAAVPADHYYLGAGYQLAWDGFSLIFHRENQITWFAVREKP